MYDYIVFRGSDVKDLRIEEAPAAKENKPPQVPNDPAIMSSVSEHLLRREPDSRLSLAAQWLLCDEIFRMLTKLFSESAKPCGDFRCLPSDYKTFYNSKTYYCTIKIC